MNEGIVWLKNDPGIAAWRLAILTVVLLPLITIVFFVYFWFIGHWEVAVGFGSLFILVYVLILRGLLHFRRNWCTHAGVSDQGVHVRFKDGSTKQIPWTEISRIKKVTDGTKIIDVHQAQIIKNGDVYDDAVICGEPGALILETWKKRTGKIW